MSDIQGERVGKIWWVSDPPYGLQGVDVESRSQISYVVDTKNKFGPKIDLRIGATTEYTSMTNQITVESGLLLRTNNTRKLLVLVTIPAVYTRYICWRGYNSKIR